MAQDETPPRRSDVVVALPWLLLGLLEVRFASQGFVRHDTMTMVVEVVAFAIVGLGHARFAPAGAWRSPLIVAIVPILFLLMILLPIGWVGLLARFGALLVGIGLVARLERERRWGLMAGIVAALLGASLARAAVLARAQANDSLMPKMFSKTVWRTIADELKGSWSWPDAPTNAGPPIVIISIDTLRWDAASEMESFARLGARGAWWERAMSTSSWTLPALASMITGEHVAGHGAAVARDGAPQGIHEDVDTLAEVLGREGYRSVGLVSNSWLSHELGVADGFDTFLSTYERFPHWMIAGGLPESRGAHDGAVMVDQALAWLDRAPERGWFLWVHLVDPHLPYLHEEGSLTASLSDERLRAGLRLDAAREQEVRDAYAREVAYTDAEIMRLLDALEAKGILDEGIVVYTADHGEEFWDHGATGHGHSHHAEVVDVPLVVVGPGARAEKRDDPASLHDVASTVAAMVGTSIGTGLDLREPVASSRLLTSQGNVYFWQQHAARSVTHKAIARADGSERVCFDIVADPDEHHPIDCLLAEGAANALETIVWPEAGERRDLDVEALRELGYME